MSIRLSTVELQDFAAHIVEDQQDLEIIQSAIEDADIDADEFVSAEEAGHLPDFLQGVSSQARNNFIQQTNQWYQELTEDDPDAPLQVSQPLVATQEQNTEFKTPFYISYAQQAPETLKSWVRNNLPQLPDVDWNNKPKPYAGLEGENVLVIYNPGSQGGRLGRLKGAIESAFSKDSTKAANAEFMTTLPNQTENYAAVQSKIRSMHSNHGPVTVVTIGGDGGIGSVASPINDLHAAGERLVKAFITPKEGTAADIATAVGSPTYWYGPALKYFNRYVLGGKDAPGNFELIPKWAPGTIVEDVRVLGYDVDLAGVEEGYVSQNVPKHVAHGNTLGAIYWPFHTEEETRVGKQNQTRSVLQAAKSRLESLQSQNASAAVIKKQEAVVAKAETAYRLACNKSITGFGAGTPHTLKLYIENVIPEFLRKNFFGQQLESVQGSIKEKFGIGTDAFDVDLIVTRADGSSQTMTTRAADVLVTNVAVNAGIVGFPGANPTKMGGAGIFILPSDLPTVLVGAAEAFYQYRFGDGTQEGLKYFPKENYILLKDGDSITITPKGEVPQRMTVNGDPLKGSVKTLTIAVEPPRVPQVMSPTSVTANKLDGIVRSPLTRWYTQSNAVSVLSAYGKQALRFVPEVDQARYFSNGNVTLENLTRYFNSAEGARTVAISPELATFVGEHAYLNAATAKSVAAHTGISLGAGMAFGLMGNAILNQTEYKDSMIARSGVNIGSMILPDLAMNPTAFMQQAATPLKFAGNMAKSVAVASAVGRGTGEIAVALGAERGGFAEGAAHLTGALGTSYGMAYHGTRMAQLAGRAVAPGVAGTATIQAATRGAATVLRFGKAVPWILAAGLAIDGADLAADQFRTVEEKDLRAKAKTKYLDQNIDDAFGSHGDWTRHATGLAQFVGVNLLSEAFSSSLVSYAQDLNDEYSDNSTRDQIRKEKEDAAKLIAVKG